jgi:RNA polymerase sigma factor (TIGR02999 family)
MLRICCCNPYAEAVLQPNRGEITVLLAKWKEGEPSAFQELMPLVYPHLREVAAAYIRRERNPDVLQGTALVHELYMRLLSQKNGVGEDRGHFYAFAAKVMRRILIDHAREMQALTRGGDLDRVPLNDELAWVNIDSAELLDLDRALDELGQSDAAKVQLVELRYFLGCTVDETADLMHRSRSAVNRDLKFIRGWLYMRLYPDQAESVPTA